MFIVYTYSGSFIKLSTYFQNGGRFKDEDSVRRPQPNWARSQQGSAPVRHPSWSNDPVWWVTQLGDELIDMSNIKLRGDYTF